MKIWVAIWHHKHGTNAEAAATRPLAQKVMAVKVIEAMNYMKAPTTTRGAAYVALPDDPLRVLELWKHECGVEDSFEFIETDLYEEPN